MDRGTVHDGPSRRTHSIKDFNTENSQYHSEFFQHSKNAPLSKRGRRKKTRQLENREKVLRQKLPRANAWLALDEYGEEDFLTVDIENEQKNFPAYPANAIMLPFK